MRAPKPRQRRSSVGRPLAVALALLFVAMLAAPLEGDSAPPRRNGKLYFTLFTQHGTGTQIAWLTVARPSQIHRVPWLIGAGTLGWSSDGRRIAYQSPLGIFVARVDGSGRRRLTRTDPKSAVFDGDPAWSPDGRWIAFARISQTRSRIVLIRPDGSGRHTLTSGDVPSWSPDGRRLAFQAGGVGAIHVFVIGRDGSGRRQVTTSDGSDTLPAWSPDGRRIVFVRELPERPRVAQLFLADPSGRAPPQALTDGTWYDTTPGWSPDGRWIVFSRGRPVSNFGLFLVRPDGSAPRRLTSSAVNAQIPRWQPLGPPRR
jgi:TolB protein